MCEYSINGYCYRMLCQEKTDCGARDSDGYPRYADSDQCKPEIIKQLKGWGEMNTVEYIEKMLKAVKETVEAGKPINGAYIVSDCERLLQQAKYDQERLERERQLYKKLNELCNEYKAGTDSLRAELAIKNDLLIATIAGQKTLQKHIAALKEVQKITGDTSDGYHTFNELYHHRAVMFSVICNAAPELAWKSKKHHDGTMYAGMFIVGIQTQDGQATYHYDIDPYWDMFDVLTLEKAPEWDGHTPAQAIERIGGIALKEAQRWIPVGERLPTKEDANAYGDVLMYNPKALQETDTANWRTVERTICIGTTHWMPLPQSLKEEK